METCKIYAVPATQALIDRMKGNLREEDQREVFAMSNRSADEAMQTGLDVSDLCWVAMYGDEPVCAWGVAPAALLGSKGVVWMLGTPTLEKIGRSVVRHSKEYIALMLERYGYLENYVDTRNILSKKWLLWCGFTMDAPEKYGIRGELFHRFFMRRK